MLFRCKCVFCIERFFDLLQLWKGGKPERVIPENLLYKPGCPYYTALLPAANCYIYCFAFSAGGRQSFTGGVFAQPFLFEGVFTMVYVYRHIPGLEPNP